MAPFETLSTVGLVLFLFLIGMELDYEQLYRQRVTAVMASGMSILLPFAMGAVLSHSLRIRFAPHGIGSIPFVLFLGIAMSITAFPVLARILEERNLQGTALGTTAILCAAVDDVVAWTLLAFALAFIGQAGRSVLAAASPQRTRHLSFPHAGGHSALGGILRAPAIRGRN